MKKILILYLFVATLVATAAPLPIPQMPRAPQIDGTISPCEWDYTITLAGLYKRGHKLLLSERYGRTMLGYDRQNLYILMESELPPDGAELLTSIRKRDGVVYRDDSIEIWIDATSDTLWQLITNSIGTKFDASHESGKPGNEAENLEWATSSGLNAERKVWICEIAIPLRELGVTGNPDGRELGIIVSRNWKRPAEQTAFFTDTFFPFTYKDQYPRFVLSPLTPGIRIDSLGMLDKQEFDCAGVITNPSTKPRTFDFIMEFVHSDMPSKTLKKSITVPAKQGLPFHFAATPGQIHANAIHNVKLVVNEESKEIYRGIFNWKTPYDMDNRWKTAKRVDTFRLAFYPSSGVLKIAADTLADCTAIVTVTDASGKVIAKKQFPRLTSNNPVSLELPPSLPSGIYTVSLTQKKGEKSISSQQDHFVRRNFSWENNTLGITNNVFAPFTALKYDGSSVASVLNQIDFAPCGVQSMFSAGRNLLAGSIHYTASNSHGPIAFFGGDGKWTKQTDSQGIYESTLKGSGVSLHEITEIDYDSCVKKTLTLIPDPGQRPELNDFYLDIPLDSRQIRLFHIIKAGSIRTNPAQKIPDGDGVIWRSTDVGNGEFAGNMHIYLWLGEMERGLAWFADNDRNFSVDDKKPVQELIRKNGILTLRVHFINRPTIIDGERTIVYGLQPSPVKPMPSDLYKPKLIIPPHGGSNPYFGIRPAYCGKYPDDNDWSYVEAMEKARKSGKHDPVFIDKWLKKHYGALPEVMRQYYRAHAYGGHAGMMAKAGNNPVLAYLEEHAQDQTVPEWETFQDEWDTSLFSPRKWMTSKDLVSMPTITTCGVLISTPKSYQDFFLYNANRYLDYGIGIYCDNTFPRCNYDPEVSNAYVRSDGYIQPSAEIWSMREYHKRMWQLIKEKNQQSRWPLMKALHITNGMILPIVCWTDIQLDLEWSWEGGSSPFPQELLEIETTGRQIGTYPHAHYCLVGAAQVFEDGVYMRGKINEEMVRSEWAMRLIYGVLRDNIRMNFSPFNKVVEEFGLGTQNCRVKHYWEPDYPITISNNAVRSVLLENGKRRMLILASWSKSPLTVKVTTNATVRQVHAMYPEAEIVATNRSFELTFPKFGMRIITWDK
ncbi:MAG: DUF6067 family protein [Victivallales bacterium]|jgi:hypothetical protein|nr:DUF6067 family protein [Victivallales bacterium]